MRVVVTGGGGFLGRRMVEHLLASDAADPVSEVVVLDVVEAHTPDDPRARSVVDDLRRPGVLDPLLERPDTSIVHLASMVSAAAEQDWSGAVETNIGSLVNVLESCRRAPGTPTLTFASSVAVFGGPAVDGPVGDATRQTPRSTYGMTKAVGELLVDDATRTGIVDGRTARLPTVIVRPGAPNRAASSFASGMFREPLAGADAVVPVPLDTSLVVIGAATAVGGLVALHRLDGALLGPIRGVALPGLTITVAEMRDTLARVGGADAVTRLRHELDPAVEAVVASWPARWDDRRGRDLGLPADVDLDSIVRTYAAELVGSAEQSESSSDRTESVAGASRRQSES